MYLKLNLQSFLFFTLLTLTIIAFLYFLNLNNNFIKKINELISKLNKIPLWIYSAIFALSSLFFHGYRFGVIDHGLYIPFIKHFINPSLYSNDYLFMQPQGNLSYFINLIGIILKKFNDIQTIFFLAYLLFLILLFWSVAKLSYSIFQRKGATLIALLLSLKPISVAGTVIGTYEVYLIPRFLGISLSLLSLYLFMEDRYILSSVFLSITFLIHALTPISMIISLFLYLLIKRKFKIFYKSLLIFFFISSTLFYKFFSKHSPSSFFVNNKHIYIMHHNMIKQIAYFPLEWTFYAWANFILFISLFLISVFIKRRRYGITSKDEKSFIIVLTSLSLLVINIVFGELIPISIIMQLQLARGLVFIYWLSIIYFAFLLRTIFNKKSYVYKLIGFSIAVVVLDAFLGRLSFPASSYILSWITTLFIVSKFPDIYNFLEQKRVKLLITIITIIFLIYPLFSFSIGISSATIQYPHYFASLNKKEKAWINTQLWAKTHTNIDDIFLAYSYLPYFIPSFRIFSERSIVFTPEDEASLIFSYKYAKEWYRRWKDFKNYDKLSPNVLVNLAKKYNADYIVVENNKKLNLPLVYKNDYFKIYKYK